MARVHLRGKRHLVLVLSSFYQLLSIANLRNPSTMALAHSGRGCLSHATRNPEAGPPRFAPGRKTEKWEREKCYKRHSSRV